MKPATFIVIFFCMYVYSSAQQNNNDTIDSLLQSTYSDSLPGASIAIVKDNKTIFQKSYGVTDIATKRHIEASSNFNICSLTKQFTAVAILQLEEKHLISLDDKLSRFFPEMNQRVADVITIQELLTHSSGIIDHYDYTKTENMKHAHNIDAYNAIKNIDSTYYIPGTQFRYSNTAYCLLALIIEKLSGMSYSEYMEDNIFKPAGMMNTIVWNENAAIKNQVTGYDWDSTAHVFKISGADEHIFFSTEGDGGIYTSVNDYILWFKALQSNTIISKNITGKARKIEFVIDAAKKAGYGFGWFIDESEKATKVYHSGSNGGFRTYSFTIPSQNYLVVIFSNRDDVDLESLVQKIVQLQWPSMIPFIKIEKLTS
ncbi:MAG TPA: serine hydrolase domain-containing protein [Parafilimonas sp.]|nr:serine hydrolase domain-containing protein [Parafilimonas sp.]